MKRIILKEDKYKKLFTEIHIDGFDWKTVQNIINQGYLVHGTNEDFDAFDPNKIKGGNRAEFGYGMYFSDAAYKAIEYGQEIYFTKKDIYNFLSLDGIQDESIFAEYENLTREIAVIEDALYNVTNTREYDYYTEKLDVLKKKCHLNDYEEVILGSFQKTMKENPSWSFENVFKSVMGNLPSFFGKYISSLFLKLGYDGFVCGNQYVIFNYDLLNKNLKKEEIN